MAGESPDKSEQQKSPGETASNERDPRLAVLGDAGSPEGDAEVRVDQPTAVFKALPRDAARKGPDRADAAREDGDAKDAARAATDRDDAARAGGDAKDGDARLRDAVAAWVTNADGPAATAGPDDDEPGESAAPEAPTSGEADERSAKAGAPVREVDQVSADADEPGAATGDAPAREADEPSAVVDDEVSREDEQRPVDQPTAVFRAVQRKPVDQPTTALKAITPQSPGSPESPAERTSKFVPLRADDVRPAAKKPEPQAPAPAPAKAGGSPASLTEAERTKQQPLPPRPPLDMLAELTNTPPPPETPVRTVVRRVKIWTPLVVLLAIIFAIVQFVRPLPAPTLAMTAKPSYTFEGGKPSLPWPSEGQGYMSATGLGTVDSFGEQKPVPIGSVAKAMTAYVILKEHPLKEGFKGEMIEIDALAETEGGYDAQNESTLNTVKAGDKISQYDALAAIMIPSANNIARLLARWDAGSEKAFVKKMNDTAKELGMTNTTYTDPSGLNHTTVSSAEDQVKLGEKLVEIPALLEITAKPWWTDPSGKKWRNYNDLVPYDGALGIKTGSTTKAGGNLLFAAHKKVGDTDQLIVGAVLAQYKTPILGSAIAASKEAMKATQGLLESRTVVKKGDVVGHVDDGLGGTTPVVATKDVTVVGWSGLTVKLELGNGGRALPHSGPAGTQVGVLTVGEGASQVRVPVALKSAMAEPGLGDKLTRLG